MKMKRQLQGIGIMLFSIMMILGMGDEPVFDLSLSFSHIFMAIGVFGFGWMFMKEKNPKEEKEDDEKY